MKTILTLAALPLLAHALTLCGQLECTIKNVKVTDTVSMPTNGDWLHKKRIAKTFFVDQSLGF